MSGPLPPIEGSERVEDRRISKVAQSGREESAPILTEKGQAGRGVAGREVPCLGRFTEAFSVGDSEVVAFTTSSESRLTLARRVMGRSGRAVARLRLAEGRKRLKVRTASLKGGRIFSLAISSRRVYRGLAISRGRDGCAVSVRCSPKMPLISTSEDDNASCICAECAGDNAVRCVLTRYNVVAHVLVLVVALLPVVVAVGLFFPHWRVTLFK